MFPIALHSSQVSCDRCCSVLGFFPLTVLKVIFSLMFCIRKHLYVYISGVLNKTVLEHSRLCSKYGNTFFKKLPQSYQITNIANFSTKLQNSEVITKLQTLVTVGIIKRTCSNISSISISEGLGLHFFS